MTYRTGSPLWPVLLGGEDATELEETSDGILKIGRRVDAGVHQADELGGVDLRAWDMEQ
jgi:hypothetical protein